jgi:hypothetical protein
MHLGVRVSVEIAIVKREDHQPRIVIRSRRGSMPGIHSERVILIEGDADEIVPNAQLAADMHGFVIMVPPGERSEWFLDMLWRVTMLYAGMPSWLRSRARVTKMIEAVMSKESRESGPTRRQARKSGQADRAQREDLALPSALAGPVPSPMREEEEEKDLKIARRVMKDNREALHKLAAQDAGRKLFDLAGSATDIEDIPRRKAESGPGITTEMVREVEDAKLRRVIESLSPLRDENKAKTRK